MKLLLYCTKSKPYLIGRKTDSYYLDKGGKDSIMDGRDFIHNGKIVAECDYEVEEIKRINTVGDWFYYEKQDEILEKSCIVDVNKFFEYLQGENGYAIHIKNLRIFDEPKELDYYSKRIGQDFQVLGKAPQNMMHCVDLKQTIIQDYILISIRPEWLCKILNGEKTIEIRKKVLKGMLNE